MSEQHKSEPDPVGHSVPASRVLDVEEQREELLRQMQSAMNPELERRIAIAIAAMQVESTPTLEFVTTGTKYANA